MGIKYTINKGFKKIISNKIVIIIDDDFKANALKSNISLTKYKTVLLNPNKISEASLFSEVATANYVIFDKLYNSLFKINFKNKRVFYFIDQFIIVDEIIPKKGKKLTRLIDSISKILVCNDDVKSKSKELFSCDEEKIALFPNILTAQFEKTKYKNEALKIKKTAFDMLKRQIVLYVPNKTNNKKVKKRQTIELKTLKENLKNDQVLFYTTHSKKTIYENGEIDLDDIGYYILACDIFITDSSPDILYAKYLSKEVIFSDETNQFHEILNSNKTNFENMFSFSKENSLRDALISLIKGTYE